MSPEGRTASAAYIGLDHTPAGGRVWRLVTNWTPVPSPVASSAKHFGDAQHRMRYYTNPLSDAEGYLHSQKGGGTVKYVKPEDRK